MFIHVYSNGNVWISKEATDVPPSTIEEGTLANSTEVPVNPSAVPAGPYHCIVDWKTRKS